MPALDGAQLWDELASLFESVQGNPVLAARSEVALWFAHAWPYLSADIEQLTGADAVAAVQTVSPFLFGCAMWPDLANVSRRGRDIARGLERLGDQLTFVHQLGIALQKMDDLVGAQGAFEEVVRRADAAGRPVMRARALAHQAQLRRSQGEPGEAMMLFHRAAETYRAVGDVLGEAKTLGDLAPAVEALGDRAGAEAYTERARTLFRSLGADHAEAVETRTLARLRAGDGDVDAALALYDEVIRLFVAAGTPDEAAASALEVAQVLVRHDDLTGCLRYASLAGQLRSVNEDDLGRGIAEIEEYARTKTAVRLFAEADSDEAADRLIANHPELRTPMGLALAMDAQVARIERLAVHRDSAARLYVEDEWREARELAGSSVLTGEVERAIRRYLLAGPEADVGLLEHLVGLLPAATLPRVRGRYLLFLARRSSDDRDVVTLAHEAAGLLDTDAADKLAGEAYAEAGMAWRRLSTGDSRQNKEEALRCLRRALVSIRRRTDREGWGRVMIALANAYVEHPQERRRNLRRAVHRFEAALTVFDAENSPEGYATAHAGLGLALSDLDLADDPRNLEAARGHLERALELLSTPAAVATVLLNLSHCYAARLRGDADANRELAVYYARQSYDLNRDLGRTAETAKAAARVGSLMARIARPTDRDAWAELLDWFHKALDGLSREETPSNYAEAIDNLANAMSEPPGAVEALFDEIASFRLEAAEVYHELGDEREWARAIYNLANTLSHGQPPDHDKIVQLYEDSLRGRPVDDAPTEWAESITGLARALVRRDRDGDVDRAEDLLRQAQATGTPATAYEARALHGRLLARWGDWSGAAEQLSAAVADAETRYLATMLSAGREAVLTRTAGLPREAAYALARAGRNAEAIALVENARARDLGRLLDRDRADLTAVEAADPAAATAFREAVSHMAAAEATQRATFRPTLDERRQLRALVTDAQARLHSAVEAIRAIPTLEGFANPPDNAAFRAAHAGVPLVYLITAEFGSVALTVAGEEPAGSIFAPLTEDELVELLAGAPSLTSDPSLLPRLIDLLGERFLGEVARQLITAGIGEAVVVATGLLGVLPVHAARYRRDGHTRHLQDDVVISFAPSARSLVAPRPHDGPLRLVGVADPKSNTLPALSHAAAETAAVHRLFPGDGTVLTGREATKPTLVRELAGATHVHLACHGDFDISQPLRSGLYLSGDDVLTLGELFDIRPLAGVRLVVASACQSAVSDVMYAPDEATGLPAGLVYAGAETVAGTLWNLNDLVAPLLVGRFYAYYFQGDPETSAAPMSAAMAMARAQAWLRDSTREEINRFADDTGLSRLPRLAFHGARAPFADQPRHWAPFVVVGPGAHVALCSK